MNVKSHKKHRAKQTEKKRDCKWRPCMLLSTSFHYATLFSEKKIKDNVPFKLETCFQNNRMAVF